MEPAPREERDLLPPALPSVALTLHFPMAVAQALMHVKITLLRFWLLVSLFLSRWPPIGHSQYYSPPEVVIPLRVTSMGRGGRAPGWLSYSLHFGGQRHVIHMRAKKLLVSRDLSVFTYTDQGALIEDQPFVQNDCHYHGFVEGDTESLVALSTCFGGLRGMLQTNGTAYEIKPQTLSATFEHLIYKNIMEIQSQPIKCGVVGNEIAQQLTFQKNVNPMLMQSSLEGIWVHQFFLELAVIVDHGRFVFLESNLSYAELEVVLAINIVNAFYDIMGLNVVLTGLEVWNGGNPYKATNTRGMMFAFCNWKKASFNSRVSHDVAHILIKQKFCNDIPFTSHYKGVCDINKNCALECILHNKLLPLASGMAHELGHNLWMPDDDSTCVCGRNKCIMNEDVEPAEAFSNCSYAAFTEALGHSTCMRNIPNPEHIFTKKRCGNGVVEDEEECDCGSTKMCAEDPCCLDNCTLTLGAVCASGLCCKDCQFMPSGTVCRTKENECDLPEWCNGISPKCPDDFYLEDGLPCLNNGICYENRCHHRDEQCKRIFGPEAINGNEICYLEMNTRGDRFGHCGMKNDSYERCNISDVLCGRVQCENVKEIPLLENHTTVHWAQFNNVTCWGTDYHFGMVIPDIGEVKDGTECGPQRLCLDRKCVPVPLWTDACLPNACNRRGPCNNKHHCHCDFGWDPPDCKKKGNGGSVDSGPPPGRRKFSLWVYQILLILAINIYTFLFLLIWYLVKKKQKSREKKKQKVETLPAQAEQSVGNLAGTEEQDVKMSPLEREESVQLSTVKKDQSS